MIDALYHVCAVQRPEAYASRVLRRAIRLAQGRVTHKAKDRGRGSVREVAGVCICPPIHACVRATCACYVGHCEGGVDRGAGSGGASDTGARSDVFVGYIKELSQSCRFLVLLVREFIVNSFV